MTIRPKPAWEPALKVPMTPNDTNIHDTVFGGVILSYMDLAGAAHARKEGCERCVTIAMDKVEFKLPVFMGDMVSFYCRTEKIGRTSITVSIHVWAERFMPAGENLWVTTGEATYVNIDHTTRKPKPIVRPGS